MTLPFVLYLNSNYWDFCICLWLIHNYMSRGTHNPKALVAMYMNIFFLNAQVFGIFEIVFCLHQRMNKNHIREVCKLFIIRTDRQTNEHSQNQRLLYQSELDRWLSRLLKPVHSPYVFNVGTHFVLVFDSLISIRSIRNLASKWRGETTNWDCNYHRISCLLKL